MEITYVELTEGCMQRLAELIAEKVAGTKCTEPWINARELAAYLGVSINKVRTLTKTTDIPCKRGYPIKYQTSLVNAWLLEKSNSGYFDRKTR